MEIIAKNYRCFSSAHPLRFEVVDGVIAFVGTNNSGKSTILKFFYEFRDLLGTSFTSTILIGQQEFNVQFKGVKHQSEPYFKYNTEPLEITFKDKEWSFTLISHRNGGYKCTGFTFNGLKVGDAENGYHIISRSNVDFHLRKFPSEDVFNFNVTTINIALSSLAKTVYFPAFRNAINVGGANDFYDISIGQAFISAWASFERSDNPQTRERAIEISNDLKEIFGYDTLGITSSPELGQIIVNINGKSFLLSELGSGFTQFILVFINSALKRPDYILLDEPELNLHPRLQVEFINRLLKYCNKGILIATHSLGLAHSVAQRIYVVNKGKGANESTIKLFEATPSFTELLGELNFSAYPELGFKKLLLVEGPTDVTVFSTFLRKIGKYQDFIIWPLGGSSMINGERSTELSELKRLGGDVAIVCWIDSEISASGNAPSPARLKFAKDCAALGINVTISERRATENYFPLEIAQKINPTVTSWGHYDLPPNTWVKGSNWRMALDMDLKSLEGTDLYEFLNRI